MRIVIFGIPNCVTTEELKEAMKSVSKTLGFDITITVLERDDILPSAGQQAPLFIKRKEGTDFANAVKTITTEHGDIVNSPADRANFYANVLNKKVKRSLIATIAFGPFDPDDVIAMNRAGGKELISICRTALSLLSTL